jgi:hypothetical protein
MSVTLSQGLPLAVLINDGLYHTTIWDRFGHYVVSQRKRVRALFIYYSAEPDRMLQEIGIGYTPMLEVFHLQRLPTGTMTDTMLNFISSATSLQSLTGETTLSLNSLQRCDRIRAAKIDCTSGERVISLESFRHLENVIYYPAEDAHEHRHTSEAYSLLWKDLTIYYRAVNKCTEDVLNRVAVTLIRLAISIPWDDISKLLLLCNTMPFLQFLYIDISDPHTPPANSYRLHPLDLSPSVITHLDIKIEISSGYLGAIEDTNLIILFDNLKAVAPHVKHLRFETDFPVSKNFLRYASSFQSLEIVFFSCDEISLAPASPAGIRSQFELEDKYKIKADRVELWDSAHLSTINPSGVKYLSISNRSNKAGILSHLRYPSINRHTPSPSGSIWGDLTTLVLRITKEEGMNPLNWENIGFSLPRVTKLEFMESGRVGPCSGFTALCQEISIRPHSFPSLEILGGSMPEWDVLFIMLEQRNFLPSSIQPPSRHLASASSSKEKQNGNIEKVSRITTLEFYYLPGIRILKPLTELLGGRFTLRTSNYEVSLPGITEAYLDPTKYVNISVTDKNETIFHSFTLQPYDLIYFNLSISI